MVHLAEVDILSAMWGSWILSPGRSIFQKCCSGVGVSSRNERSWRVSQFCVNEVMTFDYSESRVS